jgi:hypothetical protein
MGRVIAQSLETASREADDGEKWMAKNSSPFPPARFSPSIFRHEKLSAMPATTNGVTQTLASTYATGAIEDWRLEIVATVGQSVINKQQPSIHPGWRRADPVQAPGIRGQT